MCMRVCLRMRACVCECVHASVRACMQACACMRAYACMCACVLAHVCAWRASEQNGVRVKEKKQHIRNALEHEQIAGVGRHRKEMIHQRHWAGG